MGKTIILEGPDGSGKTTLANVLQERWGHEYWHTGPPKPGEDVLHSYALTLEKARRWASPVVIDRLHIGELVYGPIVRNHDLLTEEGLVLLQRIINGMGAITVLCMPPYHVGLENWSFNHNGPTSFYHQIYTRYEHFVNKPGDTPTLTWDYTLLPKDTAAAILNSNLCATTPLPAGMVGCPNAGFLFVGEKANHVDLDVPFISTKGCSHYLYHCLVDAGFRERDMAFVNAVDLSGTPNLLRIYRRALPNPTVFLLGSTARAVFGHQDSKTISLPHPQYWKRFQTTRRQDYVNMLRDARIKSYHAAVN